MINQMNPIKKSLLVTLLFCFTLSSYADERAYEIGDVLLCKKKTSSVTLFRSKKDLMKQMRSPYDETGGNSYKTYNPNIVYQVLKGDRIILLEALRDGQVYRVALIKKKKRGDDSPYFYVSSKSFKNLVFSEHLKD